MTPMSVVVLGPGPSEQGGVATVQAMIAEAAPTDVRLHHIASHDGGKVLSRYFGGFRALVELWRLRFSDRHVDAFHIHFGVRGSMWRACVFVLFICALFDKPILMHAHGPDFREFFGGLPGGLRSVVRRIFARCSALIALSESWGQYYQSELGLAGDRVVVLYNPVKTRGSRRTLVRDDREVRVVFLGQLGRRKGVPTLLAAAASLKGSVEHPWSLTIAGDGDVVGTVALARKLGVHGHTRVPGWIDSATRDALLRESDVFVLPSHNEGLPAALLEAMSFGLAVVSTPVGGIPEIVESDVNGLLVAPGDARALAAALQRLIDDEVLRQQLGESARRSVYDLRIEKYWERLRGLYLGLQVATLGCRARTAGNSTEGLDTCDDAGLTCNDGPEGP